MSIYQIFKQEDVVPSTKTTKGHAMGETPWPSGLRCRLKKIDVLNKKSVAPGLRPRSKPSMGLLTSCLAAYGNILEKIKKTQVKGSKAFIVH